MQSPPLHHPVPQHRINFDAANGPYAQQSAYAAQQGPYAPQVSHAHAQTQSHAAPQAAYAAHDPYLRAAQAQDAGMAPPGAGADAYNPLGGLMGNTEIGRMAFDYGQRYISQNFGIYAYYMSSLQYYFQVTNAYVVRKLGRLLFPWGVRQWSRQWQPVAGASGASAYALPSEDLNAPDMYIPIMAFSTFVLISGLTQGLAQTFHPSIFGLITSKAIGFEIVELVLLKLCTYLLGASGSSLFDLFAYSGYKFVAVTITAFVTLFTSSRLVKWGVFAYCALAVGVFMLRSLRYVLLPENQAASTDSPVTSVQGSKKQQRIVFLFFYGFVCQIALMWFLVL